jgi:hypothetical protein
VVTGTGRTAARVIDVHISNSRRSKDPAIVLSRHDGAPDGLPHAHTGGFMAVFIEV